MPDSRPGVRPLLITFSGVDGAGKSTSIASLTAWLASAGVRVRTVEFWNTVVVFRRLRETVTAAWFRGETGVGAPGRPVERRDKNFRPWYATLGRSVLYFLDAVHLRVVVKKALQSKADVVVFDRYIYDQLATLPLERNAVRIYARLLAMLAPRPNIAYLLDADPDAAFARKPEYPLDFLREYRRTYLSLDELLGCMTVVDPLPLEETQRKIALEFETNWLASSHTGNIVDGAPSAEFAEFRTNNILALVSPPRQR